MTNYNTVAIGSYMGPSYLRSAFYFAGRASAIEQAPPSDIFTRVTAHSSYANFAVIAAVSALEASINEWFTDKSDHGSTLRRGPLPLVNRIWEMGIPRTASFQILQKYQVALALMRKPNLNEATEPFQSAKLLIELRNWLIHFEPTMEPVPIAEKLDLLKPHKLSRKLRGRFPLNALAQPHSPFWPYKCMGAGCARWAAESAWSLIEGFHSAMSSRAADHYEREFLDRAFLTGTRENIT
jgi:hypothetical protein